MRCARANASEPEAALGWAWRRLRRASLLRDARSRLEVLPGVAGVDAASGRLGPGAGAGTPVCRATEMKVWPLSKGMELAFQAGECEVGGLRSWQVENEGALTARAQVGRDVGRCRFDWVRSGYGSFTPTHSHPTSRAR